MSQAKVDRKKELKTNRRQIVAREKRRHTITVLCGWALLVAVIGWAGYSAYKVYENSRPAVYADLSAINDYMNSLTTAE